MFNHAKVCIVGPSVDTKYIGGVATHVKNLKSLPCLLDATVIDPGSVHSNVNKGILNVLMNIIALGKKIRTGGYTHVLINASIEFSPFIKLLLILAVVPSIKGMAIHVFSHGGRFPSLRPTLSKIVNIMTRLLLKKVNCFHFLSRVQLTGFNGLFSPYPVALYSNYSNSDSTLGTTEKHIRNHIELLFVGRIVRQKGVFELLSAFEKIVSLKHMVRLTFVGDGPDLDDLRNRSTSFPKDIVSFKGYLTGDELEGAYINADALIFPTYHPEGFPYIFIEAMRAGLPVVATAEGALASIIENGVNGFKVPARDVNSLTTEITKLIENSELLRQMSENSYNYFKEYLSKSAADSYYNSLLYSDLH